MKHLIPFILFFPISVFATDIAGYIEVEPRNGDHISHLFDRYLLQYDDEGKNRFIELNADHLGEDQSLLLEKTYKLPIRIYPFNGNTIRSTIDNDNYEYALSIQHYNDFLFSKGVKPGNFRTDRQLWVPEIGFYTSEEHFPERETVTVKAESEETALRTLEVPLFGREHEIVTEKSHALKGRVYYLVSGHGGPDPGAIGYRQGHALHENEYAYDVTLRLAKNLMEHGAEVEIIVQDLNDGIRNQQYLNNSFDEVYRGNIPIPRNQLQRLRKRVEIINDLYRKNAGTAKEQVAIAIHVDSRENSNERIDMYFYHHSNSSRGKEIASQLRKTVEERYAVAQPGRGYRGSVSSRNLFKLRETLPVTVYIELGNIRNPVDQLRIIQPNNRQAIANWLRDGILEAAKE